MGAGIKCKYAYRLASNPNLMCRLMSKCPVCAHQYFCRKTGRAELLPDALNCVWRFKNEKERG